MKHSKTEDEKAYNAYKKFRQALIKHSVKRKTYEKCHSQWIYSNFESFEEDDEQHKCICGVTINKAHVLKNVKSGETVNVGFVCYPHWTADVTRQDELLRIDSIKKLCVNKWNKFTKIFYSYFVGDITEWDATFYKDIKNKRKEYLNSGGYSLTKKQKHHIDRVEAIANFSVENMTDNKKTDFINHGIKIGY
jgi:hypothetical protein